MSSSSGRPPELSKKEVSALVFKYFYFMSIKEDSVKILPGYDDRIVYTALFLKYKDAIK